MKNLVDLVDMCPTMDLGKQNIKMYHISLVKT